MKRCVIYARISVSHDESVSVARQVEAARHYAEARGWEVVGEPYVDDGVSASKNAPEVRAGWQALLATDQPYDVVIIWKLDRLARQVRHFSNTIAALEERGVNVASVEEGIDLTTPGGRMVAAVLAAFAEYEASAIADRVAASRRHLLRHGRLAGGKVPFGWASVPNPHGAGYVLAQDPKRIGYVEAMVDMAQRGDTMYGIAQQLRTMGAPTPSGRGQWNHPSVERLLRHPVLAGMVPWNPGNADKVRGDGVLLGDDGLPVVDEAVAVLTVGAWRALVDKLDNRDSPQSRPRTAKADTSPLFSGLMWCADCDRRMWRGTFQKRHGYSCPGCHQVVTSFEDYAVPYIVEHEEDSWWVEPLPATTDDPDMPRIEARIDELQTQQREAKTKDERHAVQELLNEMFDRQDEVRARKPQLRYSEEPVFFSLMWEHATTDQERRDALDRVLARVYVHRGKPGRRKPGAVLDRLDFRWRAPQHGDMEPTA